MQTPLTNKRPYTARVEAVEIKQSKMNPDHEYMSVALEVRRRTIFGYVNPVAVVQFLSFFKALHAKPGEFAETDESLKRLVGRTCKVTLRSETHLGKLYQTVDKWIRAKAVKT